MGYLDTALDTMLSTAKDQLRHVAGAVVDRTGHREQSQSITIGCVKNPSSSHSKIPAGCRRCSATSQRFGRRPPITGCAGYFCKAHWTLDGTTWQSLLIADTGRLRFVDAKQNGGIGNEITLDFSDAARGMGTEVTLRVKSPVPGLLSGALAYKALYRARALLQTGEVPTIRKNPSARESAR